mmetsp:Transcript_18219/g.29625  ORF Transcript_18219/g.29625 Transcript_18219/m.29625 type:complete len:697 (-) Transcript_18219:831-2921(-)|eukprot:CAMPEP_0203765068 /NCGR_PEP_ID=MMETSP0098-20131031/18207_1 /ASSEMBLY_ACC=CAM_ASM_000208 /TAXON_ID=96639 /ORGANISM=" , Strain NY0313808BC1" /LENGTH=696 /DNA_ID=CAMNT_0050661287 /DNA_START=2292 /DNA_END=4382 /DNA_ORIENTATION=-
MNLRKDSAASLEEIWVDANKGAMSPQVRLTCRSKSEIKFRQSTSVVYDLNKRKDSLTPKRSLRRKNSDSSLLDAKFLIQSALSAKERKERRLTIQMENIEREIRNSFGSLGGDEKASVRRRTSAVRREKENSQHENDALLSAVHKESAAQEFSDTDTITSLEEGGMSILEMEHANLKHAHRGLKDEICNMTKQLSWIETQLHASKGHARCLSRSTADWASMMKQIYQSNLIQEQQRMIRQGAMVFKHSTKKRGCGPRFLAFDPVSKNLYWSKTMTGASEICKSVGGWFEEELGGTTTIAKSGSSLHTPIKTPNSTSKTSNNVSVCPIGVMTRVLCGQSELKTLRFSNPATEALCLEKPDFIVAIQTGGGDGQTLLFEFFDSELSSSFGLGLRFYLQQRDEFNPTGVEFETPTRLGLNDSFSCSTPPPCPFVEANDSFKSNSARSQSIRSLNTSFELKSLELGGNVNSNQTTAASQLQKDLTTVNSKEAYQSILIGGASKSRLVLPLASNEVERNKRSDHDQVLKDLIREKSVLLNAVEHELGSQQNLDKFLREMEQMVANTIKGLGKETVAKTPKDWCREILLAASRTVIQGDVYAICHRLLCGPDYVLLCPTNHNESPLPIEIFLAHDGLVTIESETSYRVVRHQSMDDDLASPETWADVQARCIEHLSLVTEVPDESEQVDEKNIRSLRLEFFP